MQMEFSKEYCRALADVAMNGAEGHWIQETYQDGRTITLCRRGFEYGGINGDIGGKVSASVYFRNEKIASYAKLDVEEKAKRDGVKCCVERFGKGVWITENGRDALFGKV